MKDKNGKRKKEKKEKIAFPEEFRVVAADQSLKRPGFCKFSVKKTADAQQISDFATTNVNNKAKTKPHGQQLDEVLCAVAHFFPDTEKDGVKTYFVREKAALSAFSLAMIGQAKMAGMMDWVLWGMREEWHEITPNAVKKLVTGNGKAEKEAVQTALSSYQGSQTYDCDDESDAAAVGVAFLMQHGLLQPAKPPEKTSKPASDAAAEEKREKEEDANA